MKAKFSLCYRLLGLLVSAGGVALHMSADKVVEVGFMIRHKLAYFTIQTNIFAVLLFGYLLWKTLRSRGRTLAKVPPSLHLGVTFLITMTMLGFWLLLEPSTGNTEVPLVYISSLILHTFTPLLVIGDYVLFADHGRVTRADAAKWLIYPVGYLIFVMLFSLTIREPYYSFQMNGKTVELMYPYPFLDPSVMGSWGVAGAVLGLALVFWLFGLLWVRIDGLLAKKKTR